MVIVQGVLWFQPDEVEAFLDGRREAMEASRAEQGCLEYVLAADPLEAGRVVISERWASRDALEAHLDGLRQRPSGAAVAPLRRQLAAYEVGDTWSLG